jgi:hypothetical protein
VPLGGRPGVGAGLWLQGGIGHLARLYRLACDAVVCAVVVSVESGQMLCVGHVPSQHRPAGSISPGDDADLLWAIEGAGPNFGIVIRVTFKAYAAPTYSIRDWVVPLTYSIRDWVVPLTDNLEARLPLSEFNESVAQKLPRNRSADAYLYWDNDQLHLGVTVIETFTDKPAFEVPTHTPKPVTTF